MDILQRKSYEILKIISLTVFITVFLFSCGGGESENQEPSSHSSKKQKRGFQKVKLKKPETLDSFDKSYTGSLGPDKVHLNLNKYGTALHGLFWFDQTEQDIFIDGQINEDDNVFELEATNSRGNRFGSFEGKIEENGTLVGKWTSSEGFKRDFTLSEINRAAKIRVKIDDMEVQEKSEDETRILTITYPHLEGIADYTVSHRINKFIQNYFQSNTKIDIVETGDNAFKEEIRYEVTYLANDIISIAKHHHLAEDGKNHSFDDSHGININIRNSKVYKIRDLFKPNAIDHLNQILFERIDKVCGGALDEEAVLATNLELDESFSFHLSDSKIHFHLTERLPDDFQECGYIRIELGDLEEFFNPSGPLVDIYKKYREKEAKRKEAIEKLRNEG